MQKTGRVVVGVIVSVLALAACGESDSDSDGNQSGGGEEQLSIAFFAPASNEPAQKMLEGIEEVAHKENAEVELVDVEFDSKRQFAAIQDATATGKYDAYVILPLDQQTTTPAVAEAADAGIEVATVNLPLGPDATTADPQVEGVVGSVLYPFQTQGEEMAKTIEEACGSKSPCDVAYIPGFSGVSLDGVITKVLKEELGGKPNIKLTFGGDGQFTTAGGLKSSQDILSANPGVDVIASAGDQMILGAERAVRDADKVGQIELIGLGASQVAVDRIRANDWFASVAFLPRSQGEAAGRLVIAAARGETPEQTGVAPELEGKIPPVLTQTNADEWSDFTAEWKGGS